MSGLTKLCERCKRRIKIDAASCVCGWSAAGESPRRYERVACCFAGCPENALARVWTPTGWANVCVTHYPDLPYTPRPSPDNPFVRTVRAAYEKSVAFKRKAEGHVSVFVGVEETEA